MPPTHGSKLWRRSRAHQKRGDKMTPIVLAQCTRCKSHVECVHPLCTVCAAYIIDSRLDLRDNFIRTFLKDDEVFSDVTRVVVKSTDRGASVRKQYRVQEARKHANNADKTG